MPKEITKVTLNGHTGDPSVITDWICALNDPKILIQKSGFLFKATLDEDHLMVAVAPTLTNGARGYHYNMHLKKEDTYTLVGDVNAQGVFMILFKPESREIEPAQATRYISKFRQFADFLLDKGYTGEGLLDMATQGILKKLGLTPAPCTLAELSTAETQP